MEAPSGLCATCRYLTSQLYRYTAQPWEVDYCCSIRAEPKAPHANQCHSYEREPGAD
ncbi:MAG TPA: hypothetical protein VFZ54_16690 [Burkholderiales bacterium]|jgi:hypothetical protein